MVTRNSYEDAIKNLETAVEQLEGGELTLDQSMKIFKAAVKDISVCRKALEKAELEVEKLQQQEDGSFTREPFDE
ncbi:MAG: exodeoxyribonuclease VII small subunit [Desulfuromonadales bacterium]|nr:exodeoxyribonuclease VII small subunit [Desulfuromonadales bacterium]